MNNSRPSFRPEDWAQAKACSEAVERYQRSFSESPPDDFSQRLRWERKRAWLKAAVPTLIGDLETKAICEDWSFEADLLLRQAFQECFRPGLALFALGKLGAGELNLSSDVDLLVVADEERPEDLSSLRKFQKLLSEVTADGFVFRVDFDLRPGGRMGPLIPTAEHLIDYYGNYGETWERMAFVRLRFLIGSSQIAQDVLEFTQRFSYRRHLDYTLFEELKSMRQKIHSENWQRSEGDQVDLKLGVGGIRDVELFIHALQVIHGGKDLSLRTGQTTEAILRLSEKKLLPSKDADFLLGHYWRLRALENFVQAQGDNQTHLLTPPNCPLPEPLAKLLVTLPQDLERTDEIVSSLLGEAPKAPSTLEIRHLFAEESLQEPLNEILAIPLLSRHRERDERTRRAFLQRFLEVLKKQNADPQMALEQLKDFLKAVRAKSSFFTLFLREERLIKEIAWLFGHSRYLGRLLCFRPELLDSFVFRNQDLNSKDMETLLEDLAEKKLLGEIIEGSRFLRKQDLVKTTETLTATADQIVISLAAALKRDHPSDVAILALGKWGGREMGFRSDLDLVFVHPGEPGENDLKFAKRVVSRLTDAHRGGSIYSVDLRLRPSGKAGPLVIAHRDLLDYLKQQALPWERQAYLRARWVDEDFGNFRPLLTERPLTPAELQELNRIRIGLVRHTPSLDLKYAEGGLVDLELFAQTLVLIEQRDTLSGNTMDLLSGAGLEDLKRIYVRLRQIEQLMQLISLETTSMIPKEGELIQRLAASLNMENPEALHREIEALLTASLEQLLRLDPRRLAG